MIVALSRRSLAPLLTFALLIAACVSVSVRAAQQPASHPSTAHKTTKKHAHHGRERGQMAPTADRIEEIQTALARENAYQGEPNGKWDAATIEAMKKFQSANGLSPTGKIDALTLQKLGLGSEVAGKGAPMPPTGPEPGAAPDTQLR
jgi:peptidoglycan hydrolase-like protein with peptidoglycan-binding domain